jgi:uncharacterized protein YndB with AHSA1/START domain
MNDKNSAIKVEVAVKADVKKIWEAWTLPEHIVGWNFASPDWHTPWAENDLRKGGKFCYRMEARDGSFGFDFSGIYDEVKQFDHIAYTLGDDRKVMITFARKGNTTTVTEVFEPESAHPHEFQKTGWQAILENFRNYAESIK